MGDITLYTHAVSQSSEKVCWALDASGITYRERLLTPFVHARWLTSAGGGLFASMPLLEEAGGDTVSDSTRILEWLEARRAPFPLIPRDPVLRAQVMAAESRFDMGAAHLLRLVYGELLQRRELALRLFSLDANPLQRLALRAAFPLIERLFLLGLDTSALSKRRSQNIVERLVGELDRAAASGRRFLVGDALSVADITACALFAPLACPEEHPVYSRRDYRQQMKSVLAPWRDRPGLAWVRSMYAYRGLAWHNCAAPVIGAGVLAEAPGRHGHLAGLRVPGRSGALVQVRGMYMAGDLAAAVLRAHRVAFALLPRWLRPSGAGPLRRPQLFGPLKPRVSRRSRPSGPNAWPGRTVHPG